MPTTCSPITIYPSFALAVIHILLERAPTYHGASPTLVKKQAPTQPTQTTKYVAGPHGLPNGWASYRTFCNPFTQVLYCTPTARYFNTPLWLPITRAWHCHTQKRYSYRFVSDSYTTAWAFNPEVSDYVPKLPDNGPKSPYSYTEVPDSATNHPYRYTTLRDYNTNDPDGYTELSEHVPAHNKKCPANPQCPPLLGYATTTSFFNHYNSKYL